MAPSNAPGQRADVGAAVGLPAVSLEGTMKPTSGTTNVFISVGTAYTDAQRQFLRSFESLLVLNSLRPLKIGHVAPGESPISVVRRELRASDGAVIVAFPRFKVEKGTEFPKSENRKSIDGMKMPTMWNHLEGGIAYGLAIPMLILVEKGLDRQGILGDGSEWTPLEIELSTAAFADRAFRDMFGKWKELVIARANKRNQK
jgi:hypothetical protein